MQNKIVFYSKDLQESHLPSDLPSLGILQAMEGLTLYSKFLSYNFLHLSVQELLAAYRISQMSHSEQVKVFKKLFESPRFQPVLHYYCGFTKLDNSEIRAFISFYQHGKSNLKDILPLLHCFFEAQQPSLCQLVDFRFIDENKELNASDLIPIDFVAIGYFVTSLLATSNAPTVHLSIRNIDDYRLKLLLSELSNYPVAGGLPTTGALSRKVALHLNFPFSTGHGAKLIASFLEQSAVISELELCEGTMQTDEDDGLLYIAKALQTNSSLTKLSLSSMKLKHTKQNAFALSKMLQVNKSLKHLNLSWNEHFLKDTSCIFEGLQHNNNLISLNLASVGLNCSDPDTARSLTKLLQVNKSITHLDLSENSTCLHARACYILQALHYNTTLVNLNLHQIHMTYIDTISLARLLIVNKSLTHLTLSGISFGYTLAIASRAFTCIFKGLQQNTALLHLNLHGSHIGTESAKSITQALIANQTLQALNIVVDSYFLSDDRICSTILDALKYNCTTSIKQLYIRNGKITEAIDDFNKARKDSSLPPICVICEVLDEDLYYILTTFKQHMEPTYLNYPHSRSPQDTITKQP